MGAMPQISDLIPGVEPLPVVPARKAVTAVHAYLRACILDGRIPPETKLSQAALATQLGVSRTPLREVLRMLQEEGLVASEPNQRTRVLGFDPVELDTTYGARIMLECLGTAVTIGRFDPEVEATAARALAQMRQLARLRDVDAWFVAHGEFHGALTAGAGEPLRTQLRLLADRSARYIRIAQEFDPLSWQEEGDQEHEDLLAAVSAGDREVAVPLAARHLERTAVHVLRDCAPDYVPVAVPAAVAEICAERR